jgi:hypothetical protein
MLTIVNFSLEKKIVIKEKETTHKTDHLPLINKGTSSEFMAIRLNFGRTTADSISGRCAKRHDASLRIQRDGEWIFTL